MAHGFSPATWTVFRRDVWPIGAGIVLSALYFRIDVFLVQLWSGTEAVAFYNAVFRLVEALRLFPAAVLAVGAAGAGPRRRSAAAGARGDAGHRLRGRRRPRVLWLAAGWLIPLLYGARVRAGGPGVPRAAARRSRCCRSTSRSRISSSAGTASARTPALCALALAVNVALNARLIPAWSIEGAAWATLGTEAVPDRRLRRRAVERARAGARPDGW